jgi:long-chain acyl-CoA synthetase
MLYERWLKTVDQFADELALIDVNGMHHSFRNLAEKVNEFPACCAPVIAGISDGVEFIIACLSAWRDGQAFVPVEETIPDLDGLPEGIAHVKVTSGSSGVPRLVIFESEQIAADADNIVASMNMRRDVPNVAVISMAHSYGFSNLVLPLLLHGIPLVLAKDALPASLQRALGYAPAGVALPAVPAMWKSWHSLGILNRDKIQLAISAGAPLTLELERSVFDKTGIKIHNFLGSSECGGIAYDRTQEPRTDGRLAGSALENVNLSVSEEGCLLVRDCAVGRGYWPVEESCLGDGKFLTQDLVSFDDGGGVILEGRAGDLINIAGRKVSPSSIEAAIGALQGVELCVVFGIPSADPERVQEIVAYVRGDVDLTDLKKALNSQVPSWQQPRHWRIDPDLKINVRGKISRHEWRERFLERM